MKKDITKKDIVSIGTMLPYGAEKIIAADCGCSAQYVGDVFRGDFKKVSELILKIIISAEKIITKNKAKKNEAQKSLNKILSSQKE